jgi:hypothetical protein
MILDKRCPKCSEPVYKGPGGDVKVIQHLYPPQAVTCLNCQSKCEVVKVTEGVIPIAFYKLAA